MYYISTCLLLLRLCTKLSNYKDLGVEIQGIENSRAYEIENPVSGLKNKEAKEPNPLMQVVIFRPCEKSGFWIALWVEKFNYASNFYFMGPP